MNKALLHTVVFLLLMQFGLCQKASMEGVVKCSEEGISAQATVVINDGKFQTYTDQKGNYKLKNLPIGKVKVTVFCQGFSKRDDSIMLKAGINYFSFELFQLEEVLKAININEKDYDNFSMNRLRSIEGTSIYAGKKNEIIELDEVTGNKASNNSREIYGKIPGLNIWESDGAGIQLGIGARGLTPKRAASFNVRQNGYDISADALGYPESYYTPATEALQSIQMIRGAASLQYGSQFGGLLNFEMKKPSKHQLKYKTKNTYGSYNQFTSYHELSGEKGKFSYFSYYQYKRGDGWRPNSDFQQHQGYLNLNYELTEKMEISLDYTAMHYNAQQPGGLTENQFENDPTQSNRTRNWFQVNWNLLALRWSWEIASDKVWSARAFGLMANRKALGYLGRIDRGDPMEERNLIVGDFANFGAESRYLQRYNLGDQSAGAWVLGARYYQGQTKARQGYANSDSDADYNFLKTSEDPITSDFTFPSQNIALFSENVFFVNSDWTIVPGIRFEHIKTKSNGNYLKRIEHPLTGEILTNETKYDSNQKSRSFILFGIGSHYKIFGDSLEIYANFSQNYRGINFSDIQINNPNFKVDPNIYDERGYNADIGLRGQIGNIFTFDISGFYLRYNDRIGEVLQTDTTNWTTFRYRTNVSDARNFGAEVYMELDWWKALSEKPTLFSLSTFLNFSYINARYISSENSAISGNQVEMAPPYTLRTGLKFSYKEFDFSYQFNYVHEHFTDATNATSTSSAIYGTVPSYIVMDVAASYAFKKWFKISGGINNLTNNYYYTRRATGYPGPGIIPAQGIYGYLSVTFSIHSKE